VPQLPAISVHPSAENHPARGAIADSLAWLRQRWEHRSVLLPTAATGIAGHSYGALLAARYARANSVAGFAGLSLSFNPFVLGFGLVAGVSR
jgi:alpha-beta hydrolase superfamily lysophospholipase